jgi:hypothetical protein
LSTRLQSQQRRLVFDLVGSVNDPGKRTANAGARMITFRASVAIFA